MSQVPLADKPSPARRVGRLLAGAAAVYAGWLAMEAVHEAGHVLHARLSGGRVSHVELPWLGFSRTDLSANPSPVFVAWGGPVWGTVLPLLAWGGLRFCSRRDGVTRAAQAFAGFCAVANGIYLGVGWVDRVGDAGDLLRRGVSPAYLIAFGVIAVGAGLWLWHRLGVPQAH